MADDKLKAGDSKRRSVLGNEHVEQSLKNVTEFDADFQNFITENVWGTVWTREGLDTKTRHMVTIGILAAASRIEELALHIRATRNTGISPAEVAEILLQVAVYAGVPAANTAYAVAKRVYAGRP